MSSFLMNRKINFQEYLQLFVKKHHSEVTNEGLRHDQQMLQDVLVTAQTFLHKHQCSIHIQQVASSNPPKNEHNHCCL